MRPRQLFALLLLATVASAARLHYIERTRAHTPHQEELTTTEEISTPSPKPRAPMASLSFDPECNEHGWHDSFLDICICDDGWTGVECEIQETTTTRASTTLPPYDQECNDHGWLNRWGDCVCDYGWTGVDCEIHEPTTTIDPSAPTTTELLPFDPRCTYHGWVDPDEGYCHCFFPWIGAKCETHVPTTTAKPRASTTTGVPPSEIGECNEHGRADMWGNCVCFADWTGTNCENLVLYPCTLNVDRFNGERVCPEGHMCLYDDWRCHFSTECRRTSGWCFPIPTPFDVPMMKKKRAVFNTSKLNNAKKHNTKDSD